MLSDRSANEKSFTASVFNRANARKRPALKAVLLGCTVFVMAAGICFTADEAWADILTDLSSNGNLSGWTTYGTVASQNTAATLTLGSTPFTLTPASGHYLTSVEATGNSVTKANIDSVLGLTSGTFDGILSTLSGGDKATNFGVLTQTQSLAAGTYTFYWSYAAQDYQPFNDGVLFSLSGNGVNDLYVLASNGPAGAQGSTLVVGSYGATQWASYTFTITTAGTYQIGFASYNWMDMSIDPILFVSDASGTVTTPSSSTPIDTAASYYLASNLGSTVDADFQGGTLRLDSGGTVNSNFTVEDYSGNTIDAYGNTTTFSGTLTGTGGLTFTDSAGGGLVILTNTGNTYSGTTTIAGTTLQAGAAGVFSSSSSFVLSNTAGSTLDLNGFNETVGGLSGGGSSGGNVLLGSGTLTIGGGGTYGGVISGSGGLVVSGGTLTLTGGNTFTGSTTIATGGTLQIGNGGASGSLASSGIADNGSLVFDLSGSLTYAGVISGSGSVTQSGTGTLVLSGANTFTGGVTVSSGTLSISSDGNLGNGGTLVMGNGTTLGITATGTYTHNATVSGDPTFNVASGVTATWSGLIADGGSAGDVEVTGGGTLALTNASNSYSGGTVVKGGSTLVIDADHEIGATTGALTLGDATTAGTLKLAASINLASTRTLTLAAGGGKIDTGAYNTTVSQVIAGTGSLTKLGTGTLTFTSTQTYSGATVISAGTLQIGAGGTTGWISNSAITDNGTLAFNRSDNVTYAGVISGTGAVTKLGAGTLVLNGVNTYTGLTTVSAGTLEVGDATHATAKVAGAVTVASGATLKGYGTIAGAVTNSAGGTVSPGGSIGTLTVASYTQGSTSTLAVEISPTAASLLNVTGAAALNGTLNATFDSGTYAAKLYPVVTAGSVSGTFSSFVTSGTSADFVYGIYYAPSGKEVDVAVTPKTAGQIYGDLATASLDNANLVGNVVLDHAATALCEVLPDGTLAKECTRWSFWAQALSGTGHTDAGDGAAAFTTHLSGFLVGVDFRYDSGVSLHGAVGYLGSSLSVHEGEARADTDAWFMALAGHVPVKSFLVDAAGYYVVNTNNVTRDTGLGGTFVSDADNSVGGFAVQVSYPLHGGDVVPLARVTYSGVAVDDFAETGVGGLNLAGKTGSHTSTRLALGLRFGHTFVTGDGAVLKPHFMAAMEYDGSISSPAAALSLAASSGTDFLAPSPKPDHVAALLRLGLDARISERLNLRFDANGRFSGNQQQLLFNLAADYHF